MQKIFIPSPNAIKLKVCNLITSVSDKHVKLALCSVCVRHPSLALLV